MAEMDGCTEAETAVNSPRTLVLLCSKLQSSCRRGHSALHLRFSSLLMHEMVCTLGLLP